MCAASCLPRLSTRQPAIASHRLWWTTAVCLDTAHCHAGSAKPLPVQANGISHYFRPCSAPAPAAKRMRPSSGQLSLPSLLGSQPSQPSQGAGTLGSSHLSGSSSQAAASHPSSDGQDPADAQGQHPAGKAQQGPKAWGRSRAGSAPGCLAGFAMRSGAAQARSASPDRSGQGSRPDQAPTAADPPRVQAGMPALAGPAVPAKDSFTLPRQAAASAVPARESRPLPQQAAASLPEVPAAKQALPPASGSQFGAFRFQPQAAATGAQQQQQQRTQGPRKLLGANATAMLCRQSASALPSGLHPSLQPAAACLQAGRPAPDLSHSQAVAQPPSGQQGPQRQAARPGISTAQQWDFNVRAPPPSHAPSERAPLPPATSLKHSRGSSQSDLDCLLGSPPYDQPDPAEADSLSQPQQIQDTPVDDPALALSSVPQIPLRRVSPDLDSPPCSPAAGPGTSRPGLQGYRCPSDGPVAASPASSQMPFMYEAAGGPSPEAVPDTDPKPSSAAQAPAAAAPAAAAGSESEPSASRQSSETVSPAKKHPLAWATCQQPRLQRTLLRRRNSSQVSAVPCARV